MLPLVSVIVPAYNSASRIKISLESIIAQDYSKIEIIVVNDASKDNTLTITQEILAASHKPFKIITHDHNKGVSASRNEGLSYAKGKYIWFMDADDFVSNSFISRLLGLALEHDTDITFCGLSYVPTDKKSIHINQKMPRVFKGEDIIFRKTISPVCCLYNRDFLNQYSLRFYEGCTSGEDVEFQVKALCRAQRVSFTDECMYFYVQHNEMGSVRDNDTQEKRIMRYEHNTEAQERTASYLRQHALSGRVKHFTENVLVPQNVIRRFTLCAMKHDKTTYDFLLRDKKELHKALCLYAFRKKPEVFFKALMILCAPDIYYRMRAK